MNHTVLRKTLATAALLACCGASNAAVTLYTSQASFLADVESIGVDTFAGFSITGTTPSPLTRNAGSYSYTASVSTTSFFGAGTVADPWLSTNTATDTITFDGFSGSASAIGGLFFGSDISGSFALGDITLTATDSLGATLTSTVINATTSSFVGFATNGTLTSLTVTSVQPGTGFLWPTVDNLTLATVTPVPEPETYALMLLGLGAVAAVARRRRG